MNGIVNTMEKYVALFTSNPPDFNELYKNRFPIAQSFWDAGYIQSKEIFENVKNESQMRFLIDKYQLLWSILAIQISNNPINYIEFNCEQEKLIRHMTQENEKRLYDLF